MEFEKIVEYVEANKKEHFAKVMEENKRKLEEKSNDPYFKGYKPKMYFTTDENKYDYSKVEGVYDDVVILSTPSKTFEISPFNLDQIQYLRAIIMNDQLENDYELLGDVSKHPQGKTMTEFTNELLKMLDDFEEGMKI